MTVDFKNGSLAMLRNDITELSPLLGSKTVTFKHKCVHKKMVYIFISKSDTGQLEVYHNVKGITDFTNASFEAVYIVMVELSPFYGSKTVIISCGVRRKLSNFVPNLYNKVLR